MSEVNQESEGGEVPLWKDSWGWITPKFQPGRLCKGGEDRVGRRVIMSIVRECRAVGPKRREEDETVWLSLLSLNREVYFRFWGYGSSKECWLTSLSIVAVDPFFFPTFSHFQMNGS